MNWKLISLIVHVVLLFDGYAQAQIVTVETKWKMCSQFGCTVQSLHGTGTVIGKSESGHSLVLGCRHQHQGPAGSTAFVSLTIDGKKGHLLKRSETHDLSLMWVDGDLGKSLPISEVNASLGAELSVQGFDGSSTKLSGRPGTLTQEGLTAVAVQGNSGGPIISKTNVIYGVTTGYTPVSRPTHTVFVCATDICEFVRGVVPFGWVMWQNARVDIIVPEPRPAAPPRPSAPSDALEKRIAALESRIIELESKPPAVPSEEGGPQGLPGADASDAQVLRAVTLWMKSNLALVRGKDGQSGQRGEAGQDGAKGDPGPTGSSVSDSQVLKSVQNWLAKNLNSIKGDQGPAGEAGEQGPKGRVDVIIKWIDGTTIGKLTGLKDGDEVTVPLKKIIEEPK